MDAPYVVGLLFSDASKLVMRVLWVLSKLVVRLATS